MLYNLLLSTGFCREYVGEDPVTEKRVICHAVLPLPTSSRFARRTFRQISQRQRITETAIITALSIQSMGETNKSNMTEVAQQAFITALSQPIFRH